MSERREGGDRQESKAQRDQNPGANDKVKLQVRTSKNVGTQLQT